MGKSFKKTSVLSVGKHHSPDGTIDVTPERLQRWQATFDSMTANGQVIPMHWDHSNDIEKLKPISMDQFKRRRTRSAKDTVGRMTGFQVAEDGQSADLQYEVLTDDAIEKVESNAVHVSPVILESWKDGAGNTYDDPITHLDLVNYPVDHAQSDAEAVCCGIRMGISPVYRMAEGDAPEPPNDDTTDPAEDTNTQSPDGSGTATVSEIVDLLKTRGLVLPDDTDAANILDRLKTSILTANEIEGNDPMSDNPNPADSQTEVVQPKAAVMNLEAQAALKFGERAHRNEIKSRLTALRDSGRCTPAEFDAQTERVGAVKLSLDDDGNPATSSVEEWIDSRQAVPEGTFWDDEQKLKRLSVSEHPGPVEFTTGTGESVDEATEFALGTKK